MSKAVFLGGLAVLMFSFLAALEIKTRLDAAPPPQADAPIPAPTAAAPALTACNCDAVRGSCRCPSDHCDCKAELNVNSVPKCHCVPGDLCSPIITAAPEPVSPPRAAPAAPKADLSAYSWKQLDDEQAALLKSGKQVGTLWFDTGHFYAYDGKTWTGATSEPPIQRAARKKAPVKQGCSGGCGAACGCPGTNGTGGCTCSPAFRSGVWKPVSYAAPAAACRT